MKTWTIRLGFALLLFLCACGSVDVDEIPMVFVKGGTFNMGCPEEQMKVCPSSKMPVSVSLGDFYIGKYPVTQKQWAAVMGRNPSIFKGDNLPVEMVNFGDVQKFISKLNSMTGKNYRLPTEAEWEYAARGGAESKGYEYAGGNNIGDVAWYKGNSNGKTHPVGTKQPNELGIYDMSGNVWEWVDGWYESKDRSGTRLPSGRIIRGGGWDFDEEDCRVWPNAIGGADTRGSRIGFRLALPPSAVDFDALAHLSRQLR